MDEMYRKIGSVGKIRTNSFLQMRQLNRHFHVATAGLWSYPALKRINENRIRWVHLALTSEYIENEKRTELKRLEAIAETNPNNTILLRFQDFLEGDHYAHENWSHDDLRFYPHPAIRKLSYNELAEKEAELLSLYIPAQIEFREKATIPSAFRDLYLELSHPSFIHYLRKETPEFCAALFQ